MFKKLINLIFGTKFEGVVDLSPAEEPIQDQPKPKGVIKPYSISEQGIALIKQWEGCKLTAYKDGGGVWTIGYGIIANVKPGLVITQEKAELLLKEYLKKQDEELNNILKDVDLLSQEQYDAISSFVYNIGISRFAKSSFLKFIKEYDWAKAANQLVRRDSKGIYHGWIYDNGKKISGLINRRKAEKELFLRGSVV